MCVCVSDKGSLGQGLSMSRSSSCEEFCCSFSDWNRRNEWKKGDENQRTKNSVASFLPQFAPGEKEEKRDKM